MASPIACSMLLAPLAGASTAGVPAAPEGVAPAAAGAPASDAAARHAKRTICLKQAKDKKLVGAAKTAFIKTCLAGP
jgi:hypothetical protein